MINETYVKKYCCDDISKIENYDKAISDTTRIWDCHYRMELVETGAVVDSSTKDLIDLRIYYNSIVWTYILDAFRPYEIAL